MSISVINDFALVPPGNRGEAVFTIPGTYSWTCPTGVTNICAVCIGGGGGGESVLQSPGTDTWTGGGGGVGGSLAWSNNITVTPGATYKIQVGAGGAWGNYLDRAGNVIPAKMGGDSIIYSPADNANTPFYPTQITGDGVSYSNLYFDITTSPGNRLSGNVVVSTMVRSTAFSSNTRTADAQVVAMGGPGVDLAGNIVVRVNPVIKNYNNQAFYFTANALLGARGGGGSYPSNYYRGDYPFYSVYGTRLQSGSRGGDAYDGSTQNVTTVDGAPKTVVWLQGGGGAGGRYFGGGRGSNDRGGNGAQGGGAYYWYAYTYSAGAGGGGGCFDTTADPNDTTIPVPMAGGGGGANLYNLENGGLANLPAGGVGCGTSDGYYYSAKGEGGEGSPPLNYPQPGGPGTNYPRICRDGTNTTRTGGDYGGGGAGGVGTWTRTGAAQGGGNGGGGAVRIIWGAGRSILDPTP